MAAERFHVGVAAGKQEVGEEAKGDALDRRMGRGHAMAIDENCLTGAA